MKKTILISTLMACLVVNNILASDAAKTVFKAAVTANPANVSLAVSTYLTLSEEEIKSLAAFVKRFNDTMNGQAVAAATKAFQDKVAAGQTKEAFKFLFSDTNQPGHKAANGLRANSARDLSEAINKIIG
jgi:hypothetical protein